MLPLWEGPGGLLLQLWGFSWDTSFSVAPVQLKEQSGVVVWLLLEPSACQALPADWALWDVCMHGFGSTSQQPLAETELL